MYGVSEDELDIDVPPIDAVPDVKIRVTTSW
jgi:hypothetical protein